MIRVQRYTGNRRGIAVLIMTGGLLVILVMPLWIAVSTIVSRLDVIEDLFRSMVSLRVPPAPEWLGGLPLIGDQLIRDWQVIRDVGVQDLAPKLTPYAGALTRWLTSAVGGLGGTLLQFFLIIAISAILFAKGEIAADAATRFGRRLGGERGETTVRLAGRAIRGVALGVVVTALAQSMVGGIGLAVVGIPFASMLTAVMFILCLAQLGPGLVLIPAVVWMYYSGDRLWATVLLVFSVIAVALDNFLRPLLIRRGADLPLLLILVGVIGGLLTIGLLGIFIGPVVLAVTHTLLNAWIEESGSDGSSNGIG
jgi:predicted PurR-regulated permease PerM